MINCLKIITDIKEVQKCAVALGNFDGLHIAHKQIITNCTEYAKKTGLKSCVLLFDIHPRTLFDNKIKLLTTLLEKLKALEKTGIDFVFIKSFDEKTMKMSAEEFFGFLTEDLKAKALFAGFDYTFAHKASGDSNTLLKLGKKHDIFVDISEQIIIDDVSVSSTFIRELVSSGKMQEAKKYLGEGYFVLGNVVKGKQNGTKMGIPTANISYPEDKLIPSDGVYTGVFKMNSKEYKSLINIGKNPTFDADKRTLEVHIPEFSGDIYGMEAEVIFDKKIRDEIKFESPKQLVEQINKDLQNLKQKGN